MNREQRMAQARKDAFNEWCERFIKRAQGTLRTCRGLAKHGPEEERELWAKAASEVLARIEHVKDRKQPPMPDCPTFKFLAAGIEAEADLEIVEWNARQRSIEQVAAKNREMSK